MRLGPDRLFEELRKHDLLIEPLPAQFPHTTQSYHNLPVFGNRAKETVVERAHQLCRRLFAQDRWFARGR